ncbi:alpha/beta fold hydrolase [Idiomarina seosinensis]|uniref:alpha/beta fold hydrolase n=1 Tax=Idiomarina seosinensis TaxID=281739 RepID=UPI003850A46B
MPKSERPQKPADDDPQWLNFFESHIAPFWDLVEHCQLRVANGGSLHWSYYKVSEEAPLVIVSPGRIEATIKYQELVWDLAQSGISCAVLDHRGQGQSQRLTENPHKGHVVRFQDYVDDFVLFEQQTRKVFPDAAKRWLLGHSMGGTIASLFCCRQQQSVEQLILSSPMFSIKTAGIPLTIASLIAEGGAKLNRRLMPDRPWYFIGMGDYDPVAFEKNDLTHSANRYQKFRQQYQSLPQVQLGGPTFQWLAEALAIGRQLTRQPPDFKLPVTLFQAGADAVVSADGQDVVCEANKNVNKQVIAGARHELLMESDRYRQPVVNKLLRINESTASPQP